jgi:hypothetical protein
MRTTIRRLPPVKGDVAGGVDLLAKPVQFVMPTVRALHVRIVGKSGHWSICLQAAVTQPPDPLPTPLTVKILPRNWLVDASPWLV